MFLYIVEQVCIFTVNLKDFYVDEQNCPFAECFIKNLTFGTSYLFKLPANDALECQKMCQVANIIY